ncbi:MAG TPA: hypothetical protein VFE72_12120 [Lysobacter sp.]|nr:hypothetical protein [Lysobacter sp.]
MTRRKSHPPEGWQKSNPGYQSGGVRTVRINGVPCVEIDAGKWWDYERDQRALSKRGKQR